jgi:hypothetical protein
MRNGDATTPLWMIMICLALLLTVSAVCSRPLKCPELAGHVP